MLKLVNGISTDFQKELVAQIYNTESNKFKDLLQEAGDVEAKRKLCRNDLDALKKAKELIQMTEVTY